MMETVTTQPIATEAEGLAVATFTQNVTPGTPETTPAPEANGHASPPPGRPSAKRRGGGQPGNPGGRPAFGNKNATVHGVRGFLTVGSMPAGCVPIQRALRKLRMALED